jgi:hypothetical protein
MIDENRLSFKVNLSENVAVRIAPPYNFSLKSYELNGNTVNVTLHWQEPDAPINAYQVRMTLTLCVCRPMFHLLAIVRSDLMANRQRSIGNGEHD